MKSGSHKCWLCGELMNADNHNRSDKYRTCQLYHQLCRRLFIRNRNRARLVSPLLTVQMKSRLKELRGK